MIFPPNYSAFSVSVSFFERPKIIGLKKAKDKNDSIKNIVAKKIILLINKDTIAVKKDANAKLKKNMLGVNISNIMKIIPTTHNNCQINILY